MRFFIRKRLVDIEYLIELACYCNKINLVSLLLPRCSFPLQRAFLGAIENGNLPLVQLLLSYSSSWFLLTYGFYQSCLITALTHELTSIVDLLVSMDQHPSNYCATCKARIACYVGDVDSFNECFTECFTISPFSDFPRYSYHREYERLAKLSDLFELACARGHVEMIERCFVGRFLEDCRWGYDIGFRTACANGRIELVKWFLNGGVSSVVISSGVSGGHRCVALLVEPGNLGSDCAVSALRGGHFDVVRLLLETGRVDVKPLWRLLPFMMGDREKVEGCRELIKFLEVESN